MSIQYLRAKGLVKPMNAEPKNDKSAEPQIASPRPSERQPAHITEKTRVFLEKHGQEVHWWWLETGIPLFGFPDGDSFLFRQIFNDAAYFYELKARLGLAKGVLPVYPNEKPFNLLSFEQAWKIWEKVEKLNRAGLHIAPLTWAKQLRQTLPGVQVLLQVDLESNRDGHLVSQFEKELVRMRAELGIPEPEKSAFKANRILNCGRSFRPVEALDVHRHSSDAVLKRNYKDQIREARADAQSLPEDF